MSTLFGNNISQTYQGLIKLTDSTTGVTSVTQSLQDGLGNNIPIQVSNNTVNISGSFLVNGQPISVDTGSLVTTSSFNAYTSSMDTRVDGIELKTGSYATTGSNTFIGSQIIEGNLSFPSNSFVSTDNVSGALYFSSLNQGTLYINADGGEGDVNVGHNGWTGKLNVTGSLGVTNIQGTGSLFLQPNQSDARFVEVYNTSPTDTHITASGGQIFLGDDQTYVKVDNYGSVERIDVVAGNELVVSSSVTNLTGSLHQSGTFYPDQVDWINSSIQLGTGSYILTTDVSGVTEYDTYQNVASALQPFINTGSFSTDGLITTGSVGGSQSITGSLDISGTLTATSASITYLQTVFETASIIYSSGSNQFGDASDDTQTLFGTVNLPNGPLNINGDIKISGSIIGGTVNNGLIKIQSELNKSSSLSIPFGYITSSNPDLQTNLIFGNSTAPSGSGLLNNTLTGSIVISGSNNILLGGGNRANTLVNLGTYGYINGTGNIGTAIPTLGTGSVIRPTINNNALQSVLSLQFTTSSLGQPNIGNNLIYSAVQLNHQSGSVNFNVNGLIGGGLVSTQNITTPNTQASIFGNLFTGNLNTNLNHNSSSILYNGNIGAVIVTNNYSSSVSAAVDNINVTQNLFNGNSISLVVTGSNSGTRRTFNSNLISGRSNLINSNFSGGTGGHLVSTALLGQELIVSASSATPTVGGTVFVGRYNATGSLQESANDAVFVVGTGGGSNNRRNAIHVDSSNNTRITGSLLVSGSATINDKLGVKILSEDDNTGRINAGLFGDWLYRNSVTRNTVVGEVQGTKQFSGVPFLSGSQENLLFTGFYLAFNSGSQNTVIAGGGGQFLSGSQNTILGSVGNLQFGNNNLLIGGGRTFPVMQGCVSIGTNTSPDLLFKSGSSPIQMGYSTQITGSLDVSSTINNLKIHTGSVNVNSIGIGNNTLLSSTGSSLNNVAIGDGALRNNVVGANSVAIGNSSLQNSTEGFNLGIGGSTLTALLTGEGNIGIGSSAAQALTGGTNNTSIGYNSMVNVVSGSNNVAIGSGTLQRNVSGSNCVAIGNQAGSWSTTSNEFFVGNDNYGSATLERSGSLMYGEFNGTTANQNLRINANTKIIGDVQFSSGSNKTIGTAVLDGANPGTVVVSNSLVTANSIIMLTKQTNNHPNAGPVVVSSKGSGTFTITANHNGDTDTVAYLIINPA
jgi:hypothetical protein